MRRFVLIIIIFMMSVDIDGKIVVCVVYAFEHCFLCPTLWIVVVESYKELWCIDLVYIVCMSTV